MFARWKTIYTTLVPVGVVLFALGAAIPGHSSFAWLESVGWFGSMLIAAALILFTLALGIRAIVRR